MFRIRYFGVIMDPYYKNVRVHLMTIEKKQKSKKNYVDNERFYTEIKTWQEQRKVNPEQKPSDYIGQAFIDIANGMSTYFKFVNYTDNWKDLMVGDAIVTMCKNVHLFDCERFNNPHAYFSMITYRAFQNRIKIEKQAVAAKCNFFCHNFDGEIDEEMANLPDNEFFFDMLEKSQSTPTASVDMNSVDTNDVEKTRNYSNAQLHESLFD